MSIDISARDLPDGMRFPEGLRRLGTGWSIFFVVALVIFGLGAFAWILETTRGMVLTGLRNLGTMGGATWGLYVTFVVYFVGVSFAGITVAALIRLFNIRALRPIARMAELLTVVALILGAIVIVADLGQPMRGIINLFRYARPQSPFFGTFTMVIAGYLFASLVYLYLGSRRDAAVMAQQHDSPLRRLHRLVAAGYADTPPERERHRKASFWLALAIIPLLIIAHSTLGFVFGLQVGRPGWYSALQAPAFVVLAGVSGIGLLIVVAAIVRRAAREQAINDGVFRWLGLFLLVLISVYLYFMITELLTSTYTGTEAESAVSQAILTGEYAWIFWTSVALLVIPLGLLIWQALSRSWSVGWLVASGLAVNLAAIGKRYLIVVPSQTQGQLLPYEVGSYAPSLVEYAVIAGLMAFGALLFGLYMRFMPIVPFDPEEVA